MSLINKVLQDLDRRQPADASSSFEGASAVRVMHEPTLWQQKRLPLLGLGAALAAAFGAWSWWMPAGTAGSPIVTAQAAAAPRQPTVALAEQAPTGLAVATPTIAPTAAQVQGAGSTTAGSTPSHVDATVDRTAGPAAGPATTLAVPGATAPTGEPASGNRERVSAGAGAGAAEPALAAPAPTPAARTTPTRTRAPVPAGMARTPSASARERVPLSALRAPAARTLPGAADIPAASDTAAAPARAAAEGTVARPAQPGGKTYNAKQLRANLMAEALQFDRQGRHDEARGVLVRLLAEHPDDAPARLMLVQLQLEGGRLEEARTLLAEGLKSTPAHPGMTQALARLEAEAGRVQVAIQLLEAIDSTAGADAQYQALLGALLLQVHRYDAAAQRYLAALRTDPGQVRWLIGAGVALEELGKKGEALEAYQRAEAAPGLTAELASFVDQRLARLRR